MSFFGKYKGTVVNNADPYNQGRLLVKCSSVLGAVPAWALPCVPYAGPQVGFFFLPPIGANIWVEFEGGDPNQPIWTGCYWGTGELPKLPTDLATKKFIRTPLLNFEMNETEGITVEIAAAVGPAISLKITATGVTLTYPPCKVEISPNAVRINGEALKVLPSGT